MRVLLLGLAGIAFAAAAGTGGLDPTFGSGGTVVSGVMGTANGIALQADGAIVSVGSVSAPPAIGTTRHLPDGNPDSLFGLRTLAPQMPTANGAAGTAVAIQPDGRILAAGTFQWFGVELEPHAAGCVTRYLPSGARDTSLAPASPSPGTVCPSLPVRQTSIRAVLAQPDGRFVVVGVAESTPFSFPGSNYPTVPPFLFVARFQGDGTPDASFNGTGRVTTTIDPAGTDARAVALQVDGKLLVGGATGPTISRKALLVRYAADGALDGSWSWDLGPGDDAVNAIVVQPDGRIVLAGRAGDQGFVLRLDAGGTLDPSFGVGGVRRYGLSAAIGLALQPDGAAVAGTSSFHAVRLTASGDLDPDFGVNGRVTLPVQGAATSLARQPDGKIVLAGSATASGVSGMALARIDPAAPLALSASPASADFGGQSMLIASPPKSFKFTNTSGSTVTVTAVRATRGATYAVAHDCAILAPGASCTATVTFKPVVSGDVPDLLRVEAGPATIGIALAGQGERSLTTHYYRAILRREADAGGKAYWEAESARMASLGADPRETAFALAQQFFGSGEYGAFGRDAPGFVTDLYATFLARPPDPEGIAYWSGQLGQGMPREVALAQFMFSAEFNALAASIFGSPAARAEVNVVVDFYRGLLGRLPDSAGLAYWVARFRAAQCQGASAVAEQAGAIAQAFAQSGEYAGRGRSDSQYVGDLYNAFMRRGGDLGGVLYWIGRIAGGELTREAVRQQFVASPEFAARVAGVVAQGCLP